MRALVRALVRLVPALAAWCAGCGLLIDGTLGVVTCQDEGVVGPPACPSDLVCRAGSCVELAVFQERLGAPCASDDDCDPDDFCFDPGPFGGPDGRVCSRPCCSSSDCGAQRRFVCWVPDDGGGSFCRSVDALGRSAGGPGRAGEPCTDDGHCRSGLCDTELDLCADACCSDTACVAGGGTCSFGRPSVSSAEGAGSGFWCAPPTSGGKGRYEPCAADDECASHLCLMLGDGPRCSAPCCDSPACETIDAGGKALPVACVTVPHEGTRIRACGAIVMGEAALPVGAECIADGECRSGRCAEVPDGTRFCSDACCFDADCGDLAAFSCRPELEEGSWALRCGPK
jgi:hypothetical protein